MQIGRQAQTHNNRAADNRKGGGGQTHKGNRPIFGGERVVQHSLQERGSSEPSAQSAPPSQYQWEGMQRPLEQRNSVWEHVDVAMQRRQKHVRLLGGLDDKANIDVFLTIFRHIHTFVFIHLVL